MTFGSWISRVSALIAVVSLPASASATCGVNSCTNTRIEQLYVSTNNNIYVRVSDDISPLNCTPQGGNYLTLRRADPNSDAIYSMLLTSQAMDRLLTRIRISEGTSGCTVLYVTQE